MGLDPVSARQIPPTPTASQTPTPQSTTTSESGELREAAGPSAASASCEPVVQRDWSWVKQSVGELRSLCNREAELTSFSRETTKWADLARDAGELEKLLETPPPIPLQSIKHAPLDGQQEAHGQAVELVQRTIGLVSGVSETAVSTRAKEPQSLLKLCGKIALGVIATLGGVAAGLLIPGAGPYLAAVWGLLGASTIFIAVRAHQEHNQHVSQFHAADEVLEQLRALES
jgi:hypothetical protein